MMGSRTWALEPGQARLHSTQILLTTPTFPCPFLHHEAMKRNQAED